MLRTTAYSLRRARQQVTLSEEPPCSSLEDAAALLLAEEVPDAELLQASGLVTCRKALAIV